MKQEEIILEDLMSQESLKRWFIHWVANPLVWTEVMALLINCKSSEQMMTLTMMWKLSDNVRKLIKKMGKKSMINIKLDVICNIFQRWLLFMSFLREVLLLKKLRNLKRFYACFMNH